MSNQSNTAIARDLLQKQFITEPQFEIWYRATILKETIFAISKDYPVTCRTIFRWRNEATTLIEEVQDMDAKIEEARLNLPPEDGEEDRLRFEIPIHRGHDLDEVDDNTAEKGFRNALRA